MKADALWTDWLTILKDRGTQLPIKSKSGALLTQKQKALHFFKIEDFMADRCRLRLWTLFEPLRAPKRLESHNHSLSGYPGSFWVPSDPSKVINLCIKQQNTVCHNSADQKHWYFRAITSLFLKCFVFRHQFSSYLVHGKLKNISNISKSTSWFRGWKFIFDLTHSDI